ncbi:MAG TPA: c-type cytochrome domain-containing protein [Bacteriovoracaceae bacterium]|nr:c-type cytochrome domain-containing protein [Bacteriovoracaceae bacterium]
MKVLLLLILISSCGLGTKSPLVFKDNTKPILALEAVSFDTVKTEVFAKRCIGCHGQTGSINLETYSSAIKHLDGIKRSTLETKTMPKAPANPLNKRELDIVTAWIEAGAPDKPTDPNAEPRPLPTPEAPRPTPVPEDRPTPQGPDEETNKPTFDTIKKKIIAGKCLSCHSADGSASHIPLNTRSDLVDSSLEIVVPGSPEDSGLMIVTKPGARTFMPPVSSGIPPVSQSQRELIKKWILDGAP